MNCLSTLSRVTATCVLCTGLLNFAAGCGTKQQEVVVEPTVIPTPTENLKASLTDLVTTGQKNSGTELMKDEIEKLRGTEGVDADALMKDFDMLMAAAQPAQVVAKAKQMLEKLPN